MLGQAYRDGVIVHVGLRFSWLDRLRIFFGRTVHVHVETETENVVGAVRTTHRVRVDRIIPPRPPRGELTFEAPPELEEGSA